MTLEIESSSFMFVSAQCFAFCYIKFCENIVPSVCILITAGGDTTLCHVCSPVQAKDQCRQFRVHG